MERYNSLEAARAQLAAVISGAPIVLYATDGEGVFTLSEGSGLKALGLKPGEVVGKSLFEVYRDFPSILRHTRRALRGEEQSYMIEVGELCFQSVLIPQFDGAGNVTGIIGVATDITDRKRTEDDLRNANEQLEQFSRAVEQSPAIVIISDTDGNIEYVNPKFTEVTGYSFDEISGENPRILKSDLTPKVVFINMWRTLRADKEWRGELQNRRKDGTLYWVSSSVSPLKNHEDRVTHYIGIQEDISERKLTEESLREYTADLEIIDRIVKAVNREFDLARLKHILLEQGMILLSWAACGIILIRDESAGVFRLADALGVDCDTEGIEYSDSEIEEQFLRSAKPVAEGLFLIEGQAALVQAAKCGLKDMKSLLAVSVRWSGAELEQEHAGYIVFGSSVGKSQMSAGDVKRISHFREHAVSALAKATAIQLLKDNNEALLRTQNQLVMQQKLASLGQLTAGIAHEIRNPLNFVNNFAISAIDLIEEIRESLTRGESTDEMFDELLIASQRILDHGTRANGIIGSMLLHARKDTGVREPMNINLMLKEATDLAYHGMRARISDFIVSIVTQFDENLPALNVVPQDISRVFLNLLNNALYAVRKKKEEREAEAAFIPQLIVTTARGEGYMEVRVSDNGPGVSADMMSDIFEPFYTTKISGEGTGLGLSLSYDIIVNGHGGELFVETNDRHGADFIIHLPIT